MNYYKLYADDPPLFFWLFHEDHPNEPLRVKPEYLDLVCSSCGKVDEFRALERGVSMPLKTQPKRNRKAALSPLQNRIVASLLPGIGSEPQRIQLRTKRDFVGTAGDFFVCVSSRFVDLVKKHDVKGVEFVPITGSSHFILVPKLVVPVSETESWQECREQCQKCGRYREAVGIPPLSSISFPKIENYIFCLSVPNESVLGIRMVPLADEPVVQLFKQEKIKGISYYRMDP